MKVYIVIYNKRDAYGFGTPLRVLWETDVEIAKRLCSHPESKGLSHFLGWTYVNGQNIVWEKDNGHYDELLKKLGIRKIGKNLIKEVEEW